MKTLLTLILVALLAACSSGETEPVAEGASCANVDKTNAPAGWCASPESTVHTGKPNS